MQNKGFQSFLRAALTGRVCVMDEHRAPGTPPMCPIHFTALVTGLIRIQLPPLHNPTEFP